MMRRSKTRPDRPDRKQAPLPAALVVFPSRAADAALLTLHRLLAGGHCIAAAHRGTLQCVNRVLRFAPLRRLGDSRACCLSRPVLGTTRAGRWWWEDETK